MRNLELFIHVIRVTRNPICSTNAKTAFKSVKKHSRSSFNSEQICYNFFKKRIFIPQIDDALKQSDHLSLDLFSFHAILKNRRIELHNSQRYHAFTTLSHVFVSNTSSITETNATVIGCCVLPVVVVPSVVSFPR